MMTSARQGARLNDMNYFLGGFVDEIIKLAGEPVKRMASYKSAPMEPSRDEMRAQRIEQKGKPVRGLMGQVRPAAAAAKQVRKYSPEGYTRRRVKRISKTNPHGYPQDMSHLNFSITGR